MNIIGGLLSGGPLVRLWGWSESTPYYPKSVPYPTITTRVGGSLSDLSAAGDGVVTLHLVGVVSDGTLLHAVGTTEGTAPHFNTSWKGFDVVKFPNFRRVPSYFVRADCCFFNNGGLGVAGVTPDGGLRYATLDPTGTWSDVIDLKGEAKFAGFSQDVALRVDQNGNVQFFVVTTGGMLMHGARSSTGNWLTPFEDISRVSPPVVTGTFRRIAAELDNNGDIHVVAVHEMGLVLHTILQAGGGWQQTMNDVIKAAGGGGAVNEYGVQLWGVSEVALCPGPRYGELFVGGLFVGCLTSGTGWFNFAYRNPLTGDWSPFGGIIPSGWRFSTLAINLAPQHETI